MTDGRFPEIGLDFQRQQKATKNIRIPNPRTDVDMVKRDIGPALAGLSDLRRQTGPTGPDVLFKNSPYSPCKLPAK